MRYALAIARIAMLPGICSLSCACAFASPLVLNPGVYDVTTETLLPHLEENLRYATTRRRQCLGTQDVATLFPLLRHQAFTGCTLTDGRTAGEHVEYLLTCKNREAATGTARLAVGADSLDGVLEIKMGGKNMTLSQSIHGPRLGACDSAK